MRVVHLLRKPFDQGTAAANVLEHGAGGIHIDPCRTQMSARVPGTSLHLSVNPMPCSGSSAHPLGRWPTNMLLEHRPECELMGVKKVQGSQLDSVCTSESSSGIYQPMFAVAKTGHTDKDGMETVDAWACVPECPCADMDGQSGNVKSGKTNTKRDSGGDRAGNVGAAFGEESRPAGTPMIAYGDEGGASRFFRQFGGRR